MDFSKHSCAYFKGITLNLTTLKQFAQTFEFNDDDRPESDTFGQTLDPFGGVKDMFKC